MSDSVVYNIRCVPTYSVDSLLVLYVAKDIVQKLWWYFGHCDFGLVTQAKGLASALDEVLVGDRGASKVVDTTLRK